MLKVITLVVIVSVDYTNSLGLFTLGFYYEKDTSK